MFVLSKDLLILFTVAASFEIASASKCYFCTEENGASGNCGDFSNTITMDCGDKMCATVSYTMKALVTGITFHAKEHTCSHTSPILDGEDVCAGKSDNKCFSHKDISNQIFNVKDIEICCCKGDLCNSSTSVAFSLSLTVLLFLLTKLF